MADQTIIDGKPATRRHLLLFDEDYEFIKATYGEHPGVSAAIRIIIHASIERTKKRAMDRAEAKAIDASHSVAEIVDKL